MEALFLKVFGLIWSNKKRVILAQLSRCSVIGHSLKIEMYKIKKDDSCESPLNM